MFGRDLKKFPNDLARILIKWAINSYHMRRTAIVFVVAVSLMTMLMINLLPSSAISGTGSASGTITGTVDINISDNTISMTGLSFSAGGDTATINSQTRYLFESENDGGASNDGITFDEGTTNVAVYYYVNTTAFSAPSGVTASLWDWTWYKKAGSTYNPQSWNGVSVGGAYGAYMVQNITATTAASVSGTVTPPSGVTATGEGSTTVTILVSSDGNSWQETTISLYFVTDGTTLYFDDDSNMNEGSETGVAVFSVSATGDQVNILGNSFVLTSSIPSGTSSQFSLYFGFYSDETANSTPNGTSFSYYILLALPFGKPGTYSATMTITGSQA